MSYESEMLKSLKMPARKEVEEVLLKVLLRHSGVIKEFGAKEEIVEEIANIFGLNEKQRNAFLETIYQKENRVKRSSLWHRLLFRSADALANQKLIIRPSQTIRLTNKREWMLSEKGFDKALRLLNIPANQKEMFRTKSFEVQKFVNKIKETHRPINYNPFDEEKKIIKITKETSIRIRGFRQAVIEAYGFHCAVCKMKLISPDSLRWEVEAAHIVPHSSKGKDDIWNGLSLCRLHHWAFDVGWFTLSDDYIIEVSSRLNNLPKNFGLMGNFNFANHLNHNNFRILLPDREEIYPHLNSIRWHRTNIFHK